MWLSIRVTKESSSESAAQSTLTIQCVRSARRKHALQDKFSAQLLIPAWGWSPAGWTGTRLRHIVKDAERNLQCLTPRQRSTGSAATVILKVWCCCLISMIRSKSEVFMNLNCVKFRMFARIISNNNWCESGRIDKNYFNIKECNEVIDNWISHWQQIDVRSTLKLRVLHSVWLRIFQRGSHKLCGLLVEVQAAAGNGTGEQLPLSLQQTQCGIPAIPTATTVNSVSLSTMAMVE